VDQDEAFEEHEQSHAHEQRRPRGPVWILSRPRLPHENNDELGHHATVVQVLRHIGAIQVNQWEKVGREPFHARG
jgi:hypothetical protein